MKISSRYTVALQLLCMFEIYQNCKITSNFIAKKIGTDPSTIRYIILDLKKRNYVESKPGPGGTTLTTPLDQISLYDVYELVADPTDSLLNFCSAPNDNSYTDETIRNVIRLQFEEIKKEMFTKMKQKSVADICNQIKNTLNT